MNFYQLITKYRMQIFGFALFWIFFRHAYFYNSFNFGLIQPLFVIGDIGVDIFMFLSGFGLFFSYPKYNLKDFYKKRLLKVLPTFVLLIVLFTLLLNYSSIEKGLKDLISPMRWFFLIYSKYWFIGAIILFYFLYPIVYKNVVSRPYQFLIIVYLFSTTLLFLIPYINLPYTEQLVVYVSRLPIFVLGSVFASKLYLFEKKKEIILLLIFSIPLLILLPKDFQRMAYGFSTIGIVSYLPYLFDKAPKQIKSSFAFVGNISLEFYIVHIFLFSNNFLGKINEYVSNLWIILFIALIPTILIAWIANVTVDKIITVIEKTWK